MKDATESRNCLWCEAPIRGRVDKKFCDDSCRNAYNNRKSGKEYRIIQTINHALMRNRRILANHLGQSRQEKKVSREQLLRDGFQFRYCTHHLHFHTGMSAVFCYDYGYLPLPGESFLLLCVRPGPAI